MVGKKRAGCDQHTDAPSATAARQQVILSPEIERTAAGTGDRTVLLSNAGFPAGYTGDPPGNAQCAGVKKDAGATGIAAVPRIVTGTSSDKTMIDRRAACRKPDTRTTVAGRSGLSYGSRARTAGDGAGIDNFPTGRGVNTRTPGCAILVAYHDTAPAAEDVAIPTAACRTRSRSSQA